MPQIGNLYFNRSSSSSESAQCQSSNKMQTLSDFLAHVRRLAGLRNKDIYNDLRIPDQFQTTKDDINIIILTGHGIFCIDVKPWRGMVTANNQNWQVQVKEEDQNFINTCIEQFEDPIKALMAKMANLCAHLKRNGVALRQSLFFARVVFLSPECELNDELKKRKELVTYDQIDDFLTSFREGYVGWISDALTPSWISGHFSYRQMESMREILGKVGSWDLVQLHCGEQLKGDYQGCQYIALNRQETDMLVFSRARTLSANSLWALLGHAPQVTVQLYKRGSRGWLGKSVTATATIPSDAFVIFRISGEEADTKIPADTIHNVMLSM